MNNKERYELYDKLILELEAENRDDHPAAVMISTQRRLPENITEVSLQIQYEAIQPIDNDLLQTEEDIRKYVRQAVELLKPKLIEGVRQWVEGK